jgi:hypothetical protein
MRTKILGAPDKIRVEWDYRFPDESSFGYLGTFAPYLDDTLSGDPEEIYTSHYPEYATETIMQLCLRVTEAYNAGILKTNLTCREYFLKHVPDFIELIEFRK